MEAALDVAESLGPAARADPLRRPRRAGAADRQGRTPGSLEAYEDIIRINLVGTFNTCGWSPPGWPATSRSTGSAASACSRLRSPPTRARSGRSLCLVQGRRRRHDHRCGAGLASKLIRVCTIAPGIFDTPMLARCPRKRARRSAPRCRPGAAGPPDEYAQLAMHIVSNPMLNGETIRLDGALRMAPR